MKINKIICDGCNQEIDIDSENGLAMFEYIHVQAKLDLLNQNRTPVKKELVKMSLDLCKECAEKTIKYLEDLKKTNIKSK